MQDAIVLLSHSTVNTALQPPSSITQGATTTTTVCISWSQVSGATGYYVSYQRQDLGAPPVVTPQYEKIVGRATTSVTLSGLEAGTTYKIRVWSTDGTSVSSEAREMDVTTVESGEKGVTTILCMYTYVLYGHSTFRVMQLASICVTGCPGALLETPYCPVRQQGVTRAAGLGN